MYKLTDMVSFEGWVDHKKIPEYLSKADLFILPSSTEGMPISVLEAMSMELPIIVTNVGGMSELIRDEGGIIINTNNKEQLLYAIMDYIKNPGNMIKGGKINRKFIIDNFNWDLHANKLNDEYQQLIKTK